jgi:RHS repeat-associated protein
MKPARVLCVAFCTILATSAVAQVQTGTPQFGTLSNGPDIINIGNLNVHFTIPVLNKTGRGSNFVYNLDYDSSIWYPASINGQQYWQPVSGWGWKPFSFDAYISYNMTTSSGLCGQYGNIPWQSWSYNQVIYVDNAGITHTFNAGGSYISTTGGAPPNCPPTGPQPPNTIPATASDGSGLTLYYTIYQGYITAYVTTKAGMTLNPPVYANSAPPPTWSYLSTDSNGNQVSGANGVYTDTTGKTALTVSSTPPTSTTIAYYNTNGSSSQYVLTYSPYHIQTSFGCSSPSITEYSANNVYLVSSITLPDQSSVYQFIYEQIPANSGNYTGRVASIKLPAGNTINYSYSGGSNGINCSDGSTAGLTRTLNSDSGSPVSTWTYARSYPAGAGTSHTEVADGLNNHIAYDFVEPSNQPASATAAYYETNRRVYQGAESGTPVLARSTCYNGATSPCTATSFTSPPSQVDIYETLDGIQTHGTTSKYAYGDTTEIDTYDFGGASSRGPLQRQENWVYGYSLPGLPTSDSVYDGSHNLVGQTTYSYDGGSVISTSNVPQHTSVTGPRGNLTGMTRYASSSVSYNLSATYYDTGSLHSYTTPNGTTTQSYDTSYVYNTGTSLPTPASGVILAVGKTYDTSYTGLPLTSTDMNAQVTQLVSYDSLLRLTEVTYPDGGMTTWSYSPTSVTGNVYQNATVSSQSEVQFDGYGRKSRVITANGQTSNPWYQQDFCYDANGNLAFTSYSYQSTGLSVAKVCSGSGDTLTYDVLGRVTKAQRSNGEARTYSYTGRATMVIDENLVTRISQSDGLGRPVIVCEVTTKPNTYSGSPVSCGADIANQTGFTTIFSYNLATGTTTVSQGAQTRTFTTDWLGRTTSVAEPESGTANYTYAYNSTGLLVTRTKPRENQTSPSVLATSAYQYDSLGRLLNVSYSDGTPSTPNRYFDYDKSEGWSYTQTNLKGLLSGTTVYLPPGNAATIFSYDKMGRTNEMAECLPSGCSSGIARQLNYTYDLAGNLLSSTDGAGVTSTYTVSRANELLSLTSSLNNSTNPPSIVSNVQNGPNGPTGYTEGNSPNQLNVVPWYDSLGRYTGGWTCNGSTTHNCNGGTEIQGSLVAWKGNQTTEICEDNPNPNQCTNTGYDEFGRMTSFSWVTGAPNSYTYAYDRYGNRWAQTQTAGTGGPQPNLSFNALNNRISSGGFSYDAAGNLMSDSIHSYSYDAEGNIVSVDNNGSTAQYYYNALNQRVRSVVGGAATEFLFNAAGQRVSIWNGSTQAQLQGQYYWGSKPVGFYSGGSAHFQHQNWLGTERVRTSYSGGVEGVYGNLPFGDFQTTSGSNTDAYHFATLDHDSETNTDHAQFRQYNNSQGRWVSPDPYEGSYDLSNPQSFNRYGYVANNPLSATDSLGLDPGCNLVYLVAIETVWVPATDGDGPGTWVDTSVDVPEIVCTGPGGGAPNNGKQNPCGTSCHSPVRPPGPPGKDPISNCQKVAILTGILGWGAGPWFEGAAAWAAYMIPNTASTAALMACWGQ